MHVAVRTTPASSATREARAAILAVAHALRISVKDAETLLALAAPAGADGTDGTDGAALRAPLVLPARFDAQRAGELVAAIRAAGGAAEVESPRPGPVTPCTAHPKLEAHDRCPRCGADACVLCARAGAPCARCEAKDARARRFFRVRVTVLLVVLAGVLLYAWQDMRRRRARNAWDHTLEVAVVVAPTEALDPAAVTALRERLGAAEARFAAELARYRPGAPPPFAFRPAFAAATPPPPPPLPTSDGVLEAARHSFALGRWVRDVDVGAGIEAGAFDVRVYVVARRPKSAERALVEGRGEQGGRVAVVEVELDETMADLTLVVVAHELLHTLGATDKYDATGRTKMPEGLAEPDRIPMLPQRFAEVMARNRPVSATGAEAVPEHLDDVAVGPATAREIGWTK